MRIAVITGSRADRNALGALHSALSGEIKNGNMLHQLTWLDISTAPALDRKHGVDLAAGCACRMTDLDADLVILHGDRYEILGAAVGASIMGIPIAHLGGGDITEGSQDNNYRMAITKLASLHF